MTDTSLRVGVRRISVSPVDGQPNGSRARCDPLDQELLHSNASCERVFPHIVSRVHIAQQHSILKYDGAKIHQQLQEATGSNMRCRLLHVSIHVVFNERKQLSLQTIRWHDRSTLQEKRTSVW
ncbi:hypothetical protein PF005_g33547 [Phytophthora fragariae]|uniref:Uncharacterized protein n=2 Tax=Phytophthora fragariae TaxID=53985 RepID=A0A6A3D4H1_9STRA|nr:hypothetical protein PF009_g33332 [Phytophthora fragariae]KAE9053843.1 hypothetical protein PF006_g33426 [Phytophthora fragariae]KAE9149315.1 hypothetical protein PF005_g33547 [Phytophthora fragariae]KAE9156900.1 hypothetical protein PF002_g33497 [Phytophthora fragariae]